MAETRVQLGSPDDGEWTDITPYVSGGTFTHGRTAPDGPFLPPTLNLDLNPGWQGNFEADAAMWKTMQLFQPPMARITYDKPDGRWQAAKARLKRYRAFRRLKVRTVKVTVVNAMVAWPTEYGS